MSDIKTNNRYIFALIAGILAISMVAAIVVGGYQMQSAQAQQNSADDPTPADLECKTGEVCEQEIEKAVQSIVSTSGTATLKVTPDKVSVTIGVETRGETAEEAAAANAELMDNVLEAMRGLGIDEHQISTSWYNIWPVYEQTSPPCIAIYPMPPECESKAEITGYAASNSVIVTLDADEDVGRVIDVAVAAGATNVNSAHFFISNERQEEIRQELIAKAIANARSRADKAAEAVNMEITGVKSISLNEVYFPIFYRELAQTAEDGSSLTPILPGQQEISMTVQVIFRLS
ncbi:MAG TPA: SIMPL domain-containing protein [Nitrososphaera sp.]|nr:SIMPL domain-containing protein [Nitrososphaera sp.]